jgi:hypothetical protein
MLLTSTVSDYILKKNKNQEGIKNLDFRFKNLDLCIKKLAVFFKKQF